MKKTPRHRKESLSLADLRHTLKMLTQPGQNRAEETLHDTIQALLQYTKHNNPQNTLRDLIHTLNYTSKLPIDQHKDIPRCLIRLVRLIRKAYQHAPNTQPLMMDGITLLNALSRLDAQVVFHGNELEMYMQLVLLTLNALQSQLESNTQIPPSLLQIRLYFSSLAFILETCPADAAHLNTIKTHPLTRTIIYLLNHHATILYNEESCLEDIALLTNALIKLHKQGVTAIHFTSFDKQNVLLTQAYLYINKAKQSPLLASPKSNSLISQALSELYYCLGDDYSDQLNVLTLDYAKLILAQVSHFNLRQLSCILKALSFSQLDDTTPLSPKTTYKQLKDDLLLRAFDKIDQRKEENLSCNFIIQFIMQTQPLMTQRLSDSTDVTVEDVLARCLHNIYLHHKLRRSAAIHLLLALSNQCSNFFSRLCHPLGFSFLHLVETTLCTVSPSTYQDPISTLQIEAIIKVIDTFDLEGYRPLKHHLFENIDQLSQHCLTICLQTDPRNLPLDDAIRIIRSLTRMRLSIEPNTQIEAFCITLMDHILSERLNSSQRFSVMYFITLSSFSNRDVFVSHLEQLITQQSQNAMNFTDKLDLLYCMTLLQHIKNVDLSMHSHLIESLLEALNAQPNALFRVNQVGVMQTLSCFYPILRPKAKAFPNHNENTESRLEQQVVKVLSEHFAHLKPKTQYHCKKSFRDIDFRIRKDGTKYAFEIDGPMHYCRDLSTPTVKTQLRNNVLHNAGWQVIPIAFFKKSDELTPHEIHERLTETFFEQGLISAEPSSKRLRFFYVERSQSPEQTSEASLRALLPSSFQ